METHLITSNEELLKLLPRLMRAEVLAIDTETTGLDWEKDIVVGVSFSWDGEIGYYVAFAHTQGPQCAYLAVKYVMELVLRNPNLTKVFHNAKFDIHMMMSTFGVRTIHPYHDTIVMAFLTNNTVPKNLKAWSSRLFGPELRNLEIRLKALKKSLRAPSYGHLPVDEVGPYAVGDAVYTWKLFEFFKKEVLEMPLYWTELELIDLVLDIERKGIQIDPDHLHRAGEVLDARIPIVENELTQVVGWAVNPRSPTQVAKLLYEQLGMPILLRTAKGKPSTAEEVLLSLPEHPAIPLVLEARTLSKVKSTYVIGILDKLDASNRLHCRFNQLGAETGRFSSSKPNLQNIPREGSVPVSIRQAFVPSEGQIMVFADYTQVEMYLFAHYANDPRLLELVRHGYDFHRETGAEVFEIKPEAVTKEQRKWAKSVNFGYIYGIGSAKLARRIGCTTREAKAFLARYDAKFPGIPKFRSKCRGEFMQRGHVLNLFGRKRFIPGDKAYRSVNTLIQGSAADLLKQAMVRLKPIFSTTSATPLLTIHDEIDFEIPWDAVEVVPRIVEVMTDFNLRVPIRVGVDWTSTNWGEKHPWPEGGPTKGD